MAQHGEVLRWSEDEAEVPEIFVKGHRNLGKIVGKFFDTVLHVGIVTQVTYGDGDQEDMDEAELLYAMELKQKKDNGQDVTNEAEGDEELSGLSEEGSVYDSEDDKKALKDAKRKRKCIAQREKNCSKQKRTSKNNGWSVLNRWKILAVLNLCLASQCQGNNLILYHICLF